MNYNISAYIVFTTLMVFIIVFVGKHFYKNGRVFIVSLLVGHESLADSVNKLLLTGYCLVNIGYAFLKLKQWPKVISTELWLSTMALNTGTLILLLALLHYMNMLVIYLLSKSNFINHKTLQL